MQSWEKEEPEIEGAVNEAAAGVETKVEAAGQELGTIFRSGGSNPGNLTVREGEKARETSAQAQAPVSLGWKSLRSVCHRFAGLPLLTTYFYAIRDPACC